MDIRAIILVDGRPPLAATPAAEERIAGVPLALCEVLGTSMLDRLLARLKQAGVGSAAVLLNSPPHYPQLLSTQPSEDVSYYDASGSDDLWTAAMAQFETFSRNADLILVHRLGPFAEIDYESLIQHHLDSHNRITAVLAADQSALDCYILRATRRSDAAYLFRSRMTTIGANFVVSSGYWNPMRTCSDLRMIAMDAFARKNSIRPVGHEIKPGVWVGRGARIHRTARVLAPAYIGASSRIRGSVVLTRGAIVEHHCEVDCGSVLEAVSVLPYTYVGVGLEFINSVVGFSEVVHLGRCASVTVDEPSFVALRRVSALARTIDSAWSLVSYLPAELVRGLFSRPARGVPRTVGETAIAEASPVASVRSGQNEAPIPAMAAEMISVRRYGNE
jgi:NDP-sugar pyrophosphorylase family protein